MWVLHEVAMMFWFKLRQDSYVVDSDLWIEAVKSEERDKHVQEGTLEWMAPWRLTKRIVQKVLMREVPVTRSRNQLRHRQCSDQY